MLRRLTGRAGGAQEAAPQPRLPEGTTCIVTGGSAGIGLETARALVERGARVIVTGRNESRLADAAARIVDPEAIGSLEWIAADFSSLSQVRSLANQLLARCDRIDVLVNNAGVWHPQRQRSAEGFEDTLAVNHMATFLLTNLLLERIRASAPARIVTVSSRLHAKVRRLSLDDPQWQHRRYRPQVAYSESKLSNVLFAAELARRLAGTGVTSNSVHPGDVATEVTRDSRLLSAGANLIAPLLLTPAEGAATSIHVATASELAETTGRYFAKSKLARESSLATDEALATMLWDRTTEWVGS